MPYFDIEAIRGINTVKFIVQKKAMLEAVKKFKLTDADFGETAKDNDYSSSENELIVGFSAVSPGPIQLQSAAKIGGGFDMSGGLGTIATIASNLAGYVPAIDLPRKYSYQGTDPIAFTIPCHLVLKEDIEKDIINPLKKLMCLFLPTRSDKSIQGWVEQNDGIVRQGIDWVAGLFGKSTTDITQWTRNVVGETYFLQSPFPYQYSNQQQATMILRIGKLRFAEVIIKSVSMEIPQLTYEDGYPAAVFLSISVESLRTATTDLYADIFKYHEQQ